MRRLRSEAGFLTIWMLGLSMLLLALGGVSLDLWRAFSERQALAGLADAAALAGASGIDPVAARRGMVKLDGPLARSLAEQSIGMQADAGSLVSSRTMIDVSGDGSSITVSAESRVDLTLLRLLAPGPLTLHVSSTAAVRRSP